MKFSTKFTLLSVLAIALIIPGVSFAEFPEKPITYTIPFNPGGESDITARLQEPELEADLGVAVNVTHKPGGGGAVAWSDFQRTAKTDGYSIVGCNIPHIIGQPHHLNACLRVVSLLQIKCNHITFHPNLPE